MVSSRLRPAMACPLCLGELVPPYACAIEKRWRKPRMYKPLPLRLFAATTGRNRGGWPVCCLPGRCWGSRDRPDSCLGDQCREMRRLAPPVPRKCSAFAKSWIISCCRCSPWASCWLGTTCRGSRGGCEGVVPAWPCDVLRRSWGLYQFFCTQCPIQSGWTLARDPQARAPSRTGWGPSTRIFVRASTKNSSSA